MKMKIRLLMTALFALLLCRESSAQRDSLKVTRIR
jgi:hypothetical protein